MDEYYLIGSYKGVPLRLTTERWSHIVQEHPEVAELLLDVLQGVQSPDGVYVGNNGELLAAKETKPGKWLVVVYRESPLNVDTTPYDEVLEESFIITAYLTRRIRSLERRQRLL